jgi:hypothetical protein
MRLPQEDSSAFNTLIKSGRFSHSLKVLTGNAVVTQNGSILCGGARRYERNA